MIRFIDLGDQVYCDDEARCFTFLNTIDDRFADVDGTTYWESWDDFETDFRNDIDVRPINKHDEELLARYKSLCPKWVFDSVKGIADMQASHRIALSAPQLLDACKLLLAEWDAWQPNLTGTAKERAKKAIAKAEGRDE